MKLVEIFQEKISNDDALVLTEEVKDKIKASIDSGFIEVPKGLTFEEFKEFVKNPDKIFVKDETSE